MVQVYPICMSLPYRSVAEPVGAPTVATPPHNQSFESILLSCLSHHLDAAFLAFGVETSRPQ